MNFKEILVPHPKPLYGFVFFAVTVFSSTAIAQPVQVGALGAPVYDGNGGVFSTRVDVSYPANRDGNLTSAIFKWTAAPCPAAAKIKVFRSDGNFAQFVDERGPFDVNSTAQRVVLDPPLPIRRGDYIGVANLTSCGRVAARSGLSIGRNGDSSEAINLHPPTFEQPPPTTPILMATDFQGLRLLRNRFEVAMVATNPRTGEVTVGVPTSLSDGAGYFSLPAFTGDSTFPEVTIKMVDATGSPALGGDFWFFHSPLTDVTYTLTVRDQLTKASRAYTNGPGSPGQLCGRVDTSAFAQ